MTERIKHPLQGLQDIKLELDPNHVFRMEVTEVLQTAGADANQITEATGRIFDAANKRSMAIGNRTVLGRPSFPEADLPAPEISLDK